VTAPEVASAAEPATRSVPRVLFIIYGLEPAGPELRLLEFARGFPPHVDVHVCVIGDDLTLLDDFRNAGAKMLLVPVRKPWTEWRQLRQVIDYVRRERIEVVNSFDQPLGRARRAAPAGPASRHASGRRRRLQRPRRARYAHRCAAHEGARHSRA
jgi:hypothetical protein